MGFRYLLVSTLLALMSMPLAAEQVYWSVKISGGVYAKSDGSVAFNIGAYQPTGANPAGTEWVACRNNWVFFHKDSSGVAYSDRSIDRMLSVALAAYKSGATIRVNISRDASNNCYTHQIFDQG